MSSPTQPPRHVFFDPTPEIFATDTEGGFSFRLVAEEESFFSTSPYDEVRFVASLWYPSGQRNIDLDRAYVELRASFDSEEEVWIKLAEIEPVVPPYAASSSFDGWIVLPVMAPASSFALVGSGFDPRARLQIRASCYFVA